MSIDQSTLENPSTDRAANMADFIVGQDWLEANLGNPDLRIIQVGGDKYFAKFHIPGATLLAYNQIAEMRDGVAGARVGTDRLIKLFGQLGIAPNSKVVAYDVAGGTDSSRLIWTLATLGFVDGVILDGGLGRWYEEQRPMEQEIKVVEPVEFLPQPDSSWEITAEEVDRASQGGWDGAIIDVRTVKEYVGDTIKAPRGHIKGAKHFEWSQTLRGPRDMRLKDRDQLLEMLKDIGVEDFDQEIIVYCEAGHRASQSWLLLRSLGFKSVRLFAGSISEWRVLELPVVAGSRP
ncbi:MAG: sulfurtransferase [Magnetococcales bacterium]|nr:sulfurtransferase [Magnetococcales bacterium]